MSKQNYFIDRNLVPRVQKYMEENKHRVYLDVDEMADSLQRQYSEYGRKKKIPFRISVNKAYEEAMEAMAVSDDDCSFVADSNTLGDPPPAEEVRQVGNEQLRGMYGTPSKSAGEDIMVIDVTGDRTREEKSPTKTPLKKKKRKLTEDGSTGGLAKKKSIVKFEATISKTTFADFGGNEKLLEDVCKLIMHMKHPEVYERLGVSPPRGFLLHGPPGCGKTLLAHAIAGELEIPFLKVAATELVSGVSGESEEQIRSLFDQAAAEVACVVFIDEIDAITPKRETAQREMERRIVAQLLACMDDLGKGAGRVLVIGATNRPDSLDTALRRAGRFDREIALGIPDERARERILRVLCRNLTLQEDLDWAFLASNTPGYVGADMMALAREAAMIAVDRAFQLLHNSFQEDRRRRDQEDPVQPSQPLTAHSLLQWLRMQEPLEASQLESLCITTQDFRQALDLVQPSAQREGFATVPDVTWKDVGALADVRQELNMAILAPVRHAEQFAAVGLTSPSGVLLCGPPGCGKTLLAKAIANEAGINFISVKGPELLNMYVGESERAVRTCFQRARNSAPCVIFFDEIDALCPRRSEHGDSGSGARVVNQLLTEMDGVESRRGVFLMAATNRPDIIDPAVLRPGRLDKILHVGFPSPGDRVDILKALTKDGTRPRLADDVSLMDIGFDPRLDGYTGADLSSLVKESAIQALQELVFNRQDPAQDVRVHLHHFQAAIAKIRPSVNEKDRKHYLMMRKQL